MAKIIDYPALTAPSDSDVLVIWDIAAGSVKKITRGNLLSGTQLPASTVNTQAIATGAVDGTKISTSAILLGYAETTTNQTGITTEADLTGLSVTVTVPAGGRRVKITGYIAGVSSASAGVGPILRIKESTTVLNLGSIYMPTAGTGNGIHAMWCGVPSAGSHTYKLSLSANLSTSTNSASTQPSFILVELV